MLDDGATNDQTFKKHFHFLYICYGVSNYNGISGLGTSALSLIYTITNDDSLAWSDLRFILKVQADGEQDSFQDTVSVTWDPNSGNEPDHYQVAGFDFVAPLIDKIITSDGLDNTDASKSANALDVDFALQWNLETLDWGAQWAITVLLSDDGTTISPNRCLEAAGVGSPEKTFLGHASHKGAGPGEDRAEVKAVGVCRIGTCFLSTKT